ncbi:MAG: hypothetical protein H7279_05795 [Microbacteriaceae bacterium]|nr:hypothetical protein [Microbacteriaceae bacterium]
MEAKFELGENTVLSLRRGNPVVVAGGEHTSSWREAGAKQYGRALEAHTIGVDLGRVTADVHRISTSDAD